ncbi:hypothetical protein [Crocosphaera sp. XPORK-15E]|uniref:hypothetical protein n=1 Tax=Crocosphaera sp. XPORK-15E TaxID=3110247 RepID=UPI002B2155C9|nr:hypothetical protein [Crocosphaera sp. XPORK-15E]MEA5536790.1 hypothetical protein [Crocosphaera sp. XPORK-15E]
MTNDEREMAKQINQLTRQSPFYDKFNQLRYKSPKGFIDYDTVTFESARLLTSYQFYEPSFFDQDFTHKNSLIILNQAYLMGFKPFWLDEKLFEAFNYTQLPKALREIKRITPTGLLFVPPKLTNPDGVPIKWIFFYHRLAAESVPTIELLNAKLDVLSQSADSLSWFTVLEDRTQYGVNRHLTITDDELIEESYDMHINTILQDDGKNIDTKSEKEFSDRVTILLLQTLLYLQLKPNQLTESINTDSTRKKKISKKQKLSPYIIGEDYQVKADKQYDSAQTGNSKMTHWRRGFYRWQPYGQKEQQQHKLIWIEPVLVNG